MRRTALFVTALLVSSGLVGVRAADPASGTVTPEQTTLTWAGTVSTPTAPPPVLSAQCDVGLCDEFAFTLALGDGYWAANPGGLEIAILWAPYDGETDLDLYVFDADGFPVAQAAAVDSNAESLFLEAPADGDYLVRVVASTVLDGSKAYEGLIQVEPARAPGDGDDLLPNLVALPPWDFHIATALNLIPEPENPLLSCYPEETVEDGVTRCLRFNQAIGNAGDGMLELRFAMQNAADPEPSQHRLFQRIFDDLGGSRDIQVDEYELHLAHGHVHYRGFGSSRLYGYDWDTGRTDGGTPARIGNKVGFCLIDVMLFDGSHIPGLDYWGATGNGPRNYTFPQCNIPQETENENVWMVMGIDIGWADVYGWNLADQYIDITGLSDGLYELEQIANPNALDDDPATDHVVESTYEDNMASAIICLQGDLVTAVETAEQAEACTA